MQSTIQKSAHVLAAEERALAAQQEATQLLQQEEAERNFAIMRERQQAEQAVIEARWNRNFRAEIAEHEATVERIMQQRPTSYTNGLNANNESRLNHALAEIAKLEIFARIAARRKA